ncbi:unnamed protein product [Arabidopsis halleri]
MRGFSSHSSLLFSLFFLLPLRQRFCVGRLFLFSFSSKVQKVLGS